jgi:hypothetical protein
MGSTPDNDENLRDQWCMHRLYHKRLRRQGDNPMIEETMNRGARIHFDSAMTLRKCRV